MGARPDRPEPGTPGRPPRRSAGQRAGGPSTRRARPAFRRLHSARRRSTWPVGPRVVGRHRVHEPHAVSDRQRGRALGTRWQLQARGRDVRDGFFCPLSQLIMGQTAEVLARQHGHHARRVRCLRSRQPAEGRGRRLMPADSRTKSQRRPARMRRARLWLSHRRASTLRRNDRGLAKTAAGVRAGRRAAGHHHRGLFIWHCRRRRGGRAGRRGRSCAAWHSTRISGWPDRR